MNSMRLIIVLRTSATMLASFKDLIMSNKFFFRHIIVQEQAVTTLATVADSAQKHFQKYYSFVVAVYCITVIFLATFMSSSVHVT